MSTEAWGWNSFKTVKRSNGISRICWYELNNSCLVLVKTTWRGPGCKTCHMLDLEVCGKSLKTRGVQSRSSRAAILQVLDDTPDSDEMGPFKRLFSSEQACWWCIDLNQVCWGRETSKTCRTGCGHHWYKQSERNYRLKLEEIVRCIVSSCCFDFKVQFVGLQTAYCREIIVSAK